MFAYCLTDSISCYHRILARLFKLIIIINPSVLAQCQFNHPSLFFVNYLKLSFLLNFVIYEEAEYLLHRIHLTKSRYKTLNQCRFNVGPPSTTNVKPTLIQSLVSGGPTLNQHWSHVLWLPLCYPPDSLMQDKGQPPRSSVVTVFITIVDVQDSPPEFLQPQDSLLVYENTAQVR